MEKSLKKASKEPESQLPEPELPEKRPVWIENSESWGGCELHPLLEKGIAELNFAEPTEIQRRTLISALRDEKDIIGAAETVIFLCLVIKICRVQEKHSPLEFQSFTKY
jgi:superfamily II DNA/RNA helicase